jgi:hypothetical protein
MLSVIVFLSFLLQADAVGTQGGVRGHVVDASGGAIPALIRVIRPDNNAVVIRLKAQDDGSFATSALNPGVYSLTAYAQGFRRREVRNIAIRAGHPTDLGQIRLDLSGCDTPNTNCDYFGDAPNGIKQLIASSGVTLDVSCAVDLDRKSEPLCSKAADIIVSPRQVDIRVARENGTLYLVAMNGATLSKPDAATSDCSGVTFGTKRIQVIGFGHGVDVCVRTNRGSVSHVFFTEDIENNSSTVALWYVTRKGR